MLKIIFAIFLFGVSTAALSSPLKDTIEIMFPSEGIPEIGWFGIRDLNENESEIFKYTSADQETPLLIKGYEFKNRIVKKAVIKNKDEFIIPQLTESPVEAVLYNKEYKIEMLGLINNQPSQNLKIVITHNNISQTIWTFKDDGEDFAWDGPEFLVQWAGDLDGDKKLDFIIDLSQKYTQLHRSLFLSSYAKKGELVRKVGDANGYSC